VIVISTYYKLLWFLPIVFEETAFSANLKYYSYCFITKIIAHCPIILDQKYARALRRLIVIQ
jgi:hypothetical protein